MVSFFKQFYGSVTKTDYNTLRLGFIQKHCSSNPNFDFHKYMLETLEADFNKELASIYLSFPFDCCGSDHACNETLKAQGHHSKPPAPFERLLH